MPRLDGPILITGASGFIGSHLARRLVNEGSDVHVLHRQAPPHDRIADLRGSLTTWTVDLRDMVAIESTCAAIRPRYVFHLASDTELRFLDPRLEAVRDSIDTNVVGSLNLLVALSRTGCTQRIVRVGSLEEYGRGPSPYVESQREAPVTPYSAGQVAIAHYYQMLQPVLALEAVTLRLALTYGPEQSERFLIPALIRHCLQGRDFDLTSGEQRRDFVFVEDVVEALCRAVTMAGLAGQVVNVGSGRAVRVVDVARMVVAQCGASIAVRVGAAEPRVFEIPDLVCDTRVAERLLDWRASTPLEDGLSRTIAVMRLR